MQYLKKICVLLCVVVGAILLFVYNINSADAATTYGSEYVFNTATSYYTTVAGLYDGRFVAAYEDFGNSGYGTVKYCDVSGTTITGCSSGTVFNTAYTNNIQISRLTDSTFVVVYQDDGNSYAGTAVVGSISGTTISFSSEYVFHSSSTWYPHVDRLSDTKFVVTYRDSSNNGVARVGDTSGTWGSETTYKTTSSGVDFDSVAALVEDSSINKFVVAYRDNSSGLYDGKAIIGTVDGYTITFGTESTFETNVPAEMEVDRLTNSKFVISYNDQITSTYGFSVIGDVDGYNITFGSRYQFNDAQSDGIDIAALDDATFITVFRDGYNDLFYGTTITGYVTNNVISFGDESAHNLGNTGFSSVSYMPSTPADFAIVYMDADNSLYGTAIMGAEDAPGGPAVPEFTSWVMRIIVGTLGFMLVIFFGIFIKKKIDSRKDKK